MADATASPRRTERPLSPHLQIWRWSVTMFSSIAHRATGIALGAGALVLAWWLIAAGLGPQALGTFNDVAGHWFGRLVLFGFTLALMFHMLNGVRHLVWDAGAGFEPATARKTGWAVIAFSLVLTLGIWVYAYSSMGAF